VGKTAIVEGLAVKMARGDMDVAPLHGKALVELDMGRIVAGTSLRGSFSERMQGLKKDVERARGKVIIFVDEIHTLMGAGSSGEGGQDAANELKAALARGDFPCIGSTTLDEYRKHIEQDPAMERRFVRLVVDEPHLSETVEIVQGVVPLYEKHHQIRVREEAIHAAVQLSHRFIHDRKLPGKALDLLDLAMSRARRSGLKRVGREEVARVCSDVAKVPLERTLQEDAKRFLEMEKALQSRVIGHGEIIGRVAETIRRNYAGFSSHRPMGSFLFLGPSGVGKTELAKALAEFMYGTEDAMVRVDMSEYVETHSVARLVGAPPGYVGHDEGGQLTEALRRRPHTVVLLDEIEKASKDILPILLQILDEGRLTDSRGRLVTFRHALIVMTSNLASDRTQKKTRRVGFFRPSQIGQSLVGDEGILEEARTHFSPELWGRIEDKLIFAPLSEAELMKIAALLVSESSQRLRSSRQISFEPTQEVLEFLTHEGAASADEGARLMRQTIQRLVESPISEAILKGKVKDGDALELVMKNGVVSPRIAPRKGA
jgi:ATP-dependent Clp protease ATP-binding subunit ClpC